MFGKRKTWTERRQSERLPAHGPVRIELSDGEAIPAELVDISVHGCRLTAVSGLEVGKRINIKFIGRPALAAQIVRTQDQTLGCRFDDILSDQIVSIIIEC